MGPAPQAELEIVTNNAHKTWKTKIYSQPLLVDPLQGLQIEIQAQTQESSQNLKGLFFPKLDNTDSHTLFRESKNIDGHSSENSPDLSLRKAFHCLPSVTTTLELEALVVPNK